METNLEQAFKVIDKVLSMYKGSREEHILLMDSLNLIRDKCFPKPEVSPQEVKEQ